MALTDNLVSWWDLDEASGTRADAHGANDLTDNNTVGSAAGVVGNAADFEAANSEYLSIADNAALSLAGTGWTIHARVKLESKPSFAAIVSKYETVGNQREYWLDYRSGVDRFAGTVSPDGGDTTVVTHYANSLGSPSIGVWYDLFWWLDLAAGTLNLQVNDGPVDSVSYTGGVFDGTSPLHVGALGRAAATFFFDGLIDVVALWKRALTAAERTDLYNGGAGRDYAYVAGGTTLTAGTLSEVSHDADSVTLSWTVATNGSSSIAEQLERSPSGAGTWTDVTGAIASPEIDTGLSPGTAYDYRVRYSDDDETVYSNTVTVTTDAGAVATASRLLLLGVG